MQESGARGCANVWRGAALKHASTRGDILPYHVCERET
jgi:hypothetical protein